MLTGQAITFDALPSASHQRDATMSSSMVAAATAAAAAVTLAACRWIASSIALRRPTSASRRLRCCRCCSFIRRYLRGAGRGY